ncbi:MAG TPA: helix-turn-helix domain-containing protein [Flavobacterium sp.]|jgi:AraC-like DNA-binding protein
MNDIPTYAIITILGMGVTLLIAFLCLINIHGVNKSGNRWLGIFMLSIFFLNTDFILMVGGLKIQNAIIIMLLNISAYTIAPAFYFTVSYFITPDRPWKIKDYFHLFSFTLFYLLFSSYLFYERPARIGLGFNFLRLLFSGGFVILCCLQIFYYCLLSWIKLKKHEQNIQSFSSSIENIDLKWLRYLVICVQVMASFFIIDRLQYFPTDYYFIIELAYFIGFFAIAYYSIRQKEIYPFTADEKNEIIHTAIKDSSKKQEPKKLIGDHKLEELKADLLHLMEKEKPFLDCELNLVKLASMMDISLHQLSYLINTGFNENFYQFVNRYRIEVAKKLILDKKMSHFNFQGIAFEVGFNSKTVFNSTFKKCTGQTPSEYKNAKKHKNSMAAISD